MAVDLWIWLFVCVGIGLAAAGVWWGRRARRIYVIDHVRVEMHPACIVEDRVVENVWRAAISMTNTSRRPRVLPVFAERATVRAGRRVYRAKVYLDADMTEVNPGDVALAWVEFVLHAPQSSRFAEFAVIRGKARTLRLECLPSSSPRATRFVESV